MGDTIQFIRERVEGISSLALAMATHRWEPDEAQDAFEWIFKNAEEILGNEYPNMQDLVKPKSLSLAEENAALRRLMLPAVMMLSQAELAGNPVTDDVVIYSFMGSGASDQVTVGDIKKALGIERFFVSPDEPTPDQNIPS